MSYELKLSLYYKERHLYDYKLSLLSKKISSYDDNCGEKVATKKKGFNFIFIPIAIATGFTLLDVFSEDIKKFSSSTTDVLAYKYVTESQRVDAKAYLEGKDQRQVISLVQTKLGVHSTGIINKKTCSMAIAEGYQPLMSSVNSVAYGGPCDLYKNDADIISNLRSLHIRRNMGSEAFEKCNELLRYSNALCNYKLVDYKVSPFSKLDSPFHHIVAVDYTTKKEGEEKRKRLASCITGDNYVIIDALKVPAKVYGNI